MADDVFLTVRNCITEVLLVPSEKVTPEADLFADLHATSLARVEILMALEEAFDIRVPDSEVADIRTVEDIRRLVAGLS